MKCRATWLLLPPSATAVYTPPLLSRARGACRDACCRVTGRYPDGAEYVAGLFPAALQGKFAQVSACCGGGGITCCGGGGITCCGGGGIAAAETAVTGMFVFLILPTASSSC